MFSNVYKPQRLDSVTVSCFFRSDDAKRFSETGNNHVSEDAYREPFVSHTESFYEMAVYIKNQLEPTSGQK